jgi:hypothetical protein
MSDNYSLLRDAVLSRRRVIAFYEGYERHFCPHVLGTKQGEWQVLGFQYAGGSRTGLPPEGQWRCMRVQGLTQVRVANGDWRTGTGHSRPQTCVDVVDVEVSY